MADCCFVDNDIVLKLSAANVFWEAIASVGLQQDSLRVLATAQYVRCLEFLSEAPELATLKARWRGQVICLEQLMLKLIEVQGFKWVKERALPAREYDIALKACFGSGELATETNVRQMLAAYVQDVRNRAPDLLVDLWFYSIGNPGIAASICCIKCIVSCNATTMR